MSVPPITIGVPVYNGENYLSEAIDSLTQQTFGDFTLIISDNASTDNTEEIARTLAEKDPRIVYHRQASNLGAAANYNFSLAQARSEYFMWHAHDDLRDPRYLELALGALEEASDTCLAFSRAQWIGPDGTLGEVKPSFPALSERTPHRRLRAVIGYGTDLIFGLVRRELLAATGGHGSFMGGDRLTVFELSLQGRFVVLPDVLWFNRRHPDQYTQIRNDRERMRAWWAPDIAGKITFPRWRGFAGYSKAIRRYPLTSAERIKCWGALAASLGDNRMYLAKLLVRDVMNAAGQVPTALRDRRRAADL